MDNEIRNLIDNEIYPMVVTPIEKYIKPRMTSAERGIEKKFFYK